MAESKNKKYLSDKKPLRLTRLGKIDKMDHRFWLFTFCNVPIGKLAEYEKRFVKTFKF